MPMENSATLYMGVKIMPTSQHRVDHAAHPAWWPRAALADAATGQALPPVVHTEPCATREEADALALRIAKRRIRDALHQG